MVREKLNFFPRQPDIQNAIDISLLFRDFWQFCDIGHFHDIALFVSGRSHFCHFILDTPDTKGTTILELLFPNNANFPHGTSSLSLLT